MKGSGQNFLCSLVACTLLYALPAIAGSWGENWSSMVWSGVAAVPSLG